MSDTLTNCEFSLIFPQFKKILISTERPKCIDPLSDEVYRKGEIWSLSECAHCLCGDFQTGNCSSIGCPRPQCDNPFKMKGRCCLMCPADYARGLFVLCGLC